MWKPSISWMTKQSLIFFTALLLLKIKTPLSLLPWIISLKQIPSLQILLFWKNENQWLPERLENCIFLGLNLQKKNTSMVEVQSSLLTLETTVDKTVSPQGPFSGFYGDFWTYRMVRLNFLIYQLQLCRCWTSTGQGPLDTVESSGTAAKWTLKWDCFINQFGSLSL